MKLKISTEEDNFLTIIADLRACGHTGLADSIEQAITAYREEAKKRQEEQRQAASQPKSVNPWD